MRRPAAASRCRARFASKPMPGTSGQERIPDWDGPVSRETLPIHRRAAVPDGGVRRPSGHRGLARPASTIAFRRLRANGGSVRAPKGGSPMIDLAASAADALPADAASAALAGRVWRPDVDGPSVVALRDGVAVDVSRRFPTMRDLCEAPDPGRRAPRGRGRAPRPARRHPRQHAARAARPREAVAPRADRPAGGQGRRRDLRDLACWSASSRSGRGAIRTPRGASARRWAA